MIQWIGIWSKCFSFSFTEGELHRGGEEAVKSGHQLAQALPAVVISDAPVDNFNSFILPLISVNEHMSQVSMQEGRGKDTSIKKNIFTKCFES